LEQQPPKIRTSVGAQIWRMERVVEEGAAGDSGEEDVDFDFDCETVPLGLKSPLALG
jgi:hypothetical protein